MGLTFLRCLLLLTVSAWMVSCSTPQTRSKEKSDSFSRMDKDQQRLVLEGRITEGLSQDAVYIALGEPYKKRKGRFQGKDMQSWIYGQLESFTYPRYRQQIYRDSKGRVFSTPIYEPVMDSRMVETFAVFFDQGRVIGWQEL